MIFTKEMLDKFIVDELANYYNAEKSVYKFKFKDKIKKILFAILGGKKQWIAPTNKIDGNKIKNIIIFRYDAIGDYFITSSAIRWLKKALPDAKIDMITSYRNQVIAENDPFINEAFPLKYSGNMSLSMLKIAKYRKKNHYDITLAMIFSKTTKSAIMSQLFAPDSHKITVNHNKRSQIYGLVFDRLTDTAIPGYSWAEKMVKSVADNIEPINQATDADAQPYIYIKEKTYNNIIPLLKEKELNYDLNTNNIFFYGDNADFYQIQNGYKYCVINIAGTEKNRIWDSNNVIQYCNSLINKYPDLRIFISGGPVYKLQVDKIVGFINSPKCFTLNIGLLEFIAFTAGAYFVVTPDTGVVHFSAAANVPLIVLYAEKGKILDWFPHNTKFISVLTPDIESINFITNEEMIKATDLLIAQIEEK